MIRRRERQNIWTQKPVKEPQMLNHLLISFLRMQPLRLELGAKSECDFSYRNAHMYKYPYQGNARRYNKGKKIIES